MLSHRSYATSKIKRLIVIPLTLACMFCISKNAFSQNNVTIIPFGIEDTASVLQTTYDYVLAHPDLVCKDTKCKVIGFNISFLPKGKEMKGPYPNNGTSKMQGVAADVVKELKESKIANTRIFIENIHVSCNGKDMIAAPVYMICTQ